MLESEQHFAEAEKNFRSQYEILEVLGEGAYGKVRKVRCCKTNMMFAMKQMKITNAQEEGVPSTAIREIAILKELSHDSIVQLVDIFCKPGELSLVFELLDSDLKKYMKSLGAPMQPPQVRDFARQLLIGIEFCHANRIIHRDLKPQNLLIDTRSLRLKLADFGLARAFSLPVPQYTHEVVTVWYRPLEILLGSKLYSVPVDLWGVGCIFYEMVSGKPLFPGTKVEDELYLIFKALGYPTEATFPGVTKNSEFLALNLPKFPTFDPSVFPILVPRLNSDGIALLASLLKYNPKSRASAVESLNHKYFSFLPAEVYQLDNSQSIFDVPNLVLAKDPGAKLNNAILYESCI